MRTITLRATYSVVIAGKYMGSDRLTKKFVGYDLAEKFDSAVSNVINTFGEVGGVRVRKPKYGKSVFVPGSDKGNFRDSIVIDKAPEFYFQAQIPVIFDVDISDAEDEKLFGKDYKTVLSNIDISKQRIRFAIPELPSMFESYFAKINKPLQSQLLSGMQHVEDVSDVSVDKFRVIGLKLTSWKEWESSLIKSKNVIESLGVGMDVQGVVDYINALKSPYMTAKVSGKLVIVSFDTSTVRTLHDIAEGYREDILDVVINLPKGKVPTTMVTPLDEMVLGNNGHWYYITVMRGGYYDADTISRLLPKHKVEFTESNGLSIIYKDTARFETYVKDLEVFLRRELSRNYSGFTVEPIRTYILNNREFSFVVNVDRVEGSKISHGNLPEAFDFDGEGNITDETKAKTLLTLLKKLRLPNTGVILSSLRNNRVNFYIKNYKDIKTAIIYITGNLLNFGKVSSTTPYILPTILSNHRVFAEITFTIDIQIKDEASHELFCEKIRIVLSGYRMEFFNYTPNSHSFSVVVFVPLGDRVGGILKRIEKTLSMVFDTKDFSIGYESTTMDEELELRLDASLLRMKPQNTSKGNLPEAYTGNTKVDDRFLEKIMQRLPEGLKATVNSADHNGTYRFIFESSIFKKHFDILISPLQEAISKINVGGNILFINYAQATDDSLWFYFDVGGSFTDKTYDYVSLLQDELGDNFSVYADGKNQINVALSLKSDRVIQHISELSLEVVKARLDSIGVKYSVEKRFIGIRLAMRGILEWGLQYAYLGRDFRITTDIIDNSTTVGNLPESIMTIPEAIAILEVKILQGLAETLGNVNVSGFSETLQSSTITLSDMKTSMESEGFKVMGSRLIDDEEVLRGMLDLVIDTDEGKEIKRLTTSLGRYASSIVGYKVTDSDTYDSGSGRDSVIKLVIQNFASKSSQLEFQKSEILKFMPKGTTVDIEKSVGKDIFWKVTCSVPYDREATESKYGERVVNILLSWGVKKNDIEMNTHHVIIPTTNYQDYIKINVVFLIHKRTSTSRGIMPESKTF